MMKLQNQEQMEEAPKTGRHSMLMIILPEYCRKAATTKKQKMQKYPEK